MNERVDKPGLGEPIAVWTTLGAVGVAAFVTGARGERPSDPDWAAGWRQTLAYLGHPVALIAPAMALVASQGMDQNHPGMGVASALAPAALAGWGVSRRPFGVGGGAGAVLAGAVVAGSGGLTVHSVLRGTRAGWAAPLPGDGWRQTIGGILIGGAVPWFLADAGIYAGDVPAIRRLYLSRDTPIAPGEVAVHLGHHHGMDGTLLALSGLALSRQLPTLPAGPSRSALSLWLAWLVVYGTARWLEDTWNEQVVKRGWARRKPPVVVRAGKPEGRWTWAALAGLAVASHLGWFRREAAAPIRPRSWPLPVQAGSAAPCARWVGGARSLVATAPTGERGGDAEADEHRARDQPLAAGVGAVAPEHVPGRPSDQRVETVAGDS